MKPRNILLALKDQLPLKRFLRNLFKGHLFGLFHRRSHFTSTGGNKVIYNTKETAKRCAEAMIKKKGIYFSNYKCPWCNGFHIGKKS